MHTRLGPLPVPNAVVRARGHVAAGSLEVWALLQLLDANAYAQQKDLPDLVRFLLGTGVRIGEALALRGRMWTWSRASW